MARILVTGSSDGLGLATFQDLVAKGHDVTAHVRSEARRAEVTTQLVGAQAVLVGDLASQNETESLAAAANEMGNYDAVIHNAGIGSDEARMITVDGREHVLAINAIAPYLLTSLIQPPRRLIYVTSGQHLRGTPRLDDLDWARRGWDPLQAYADSKLLLSTVAFAVARLWTDVATNTMEPGWVPTKMAHYDAPDDLTLGHVTQVWLAIGAEPETALSGGYYYHQLPQRANPVALDQRFQDQVLERFAELTGVELPTRR